MENAKKKALYEEMIKNAAEKRELLDNEAFKKVLAEIGTIREIYSQKCLKELESPIIDRDVLEEYRWRCIAIQWLLNVLKNTVDSGERAEKELEKLLDFEKKRGEKGV